MSEFKVTLEKINKVWPHPNADRLDIATIEGLDFNFVVSKDKHTIGDEVVFFPIDSLLPNWIIEKMGLVGRLSGKLKNRVKTVRLRGQLSQGLVVFPNELDMLLTFAKLGADLAEHLGVTKYEPPVVVTSNANLIGLPNGVSVYDIESVQRFGEIADLLMDQNVMVTEKIEGSHWTCVATLANSSALDLVDKWVFQVGQRNYMIEPIPTSKGHTWLDAFQKVEEGIQMLA